ncbi:monovalent cation/H(+) antiporter subunit G [Jannaschia aquimarina]|uniref:MrpG protein n=1 Tax=Jannaschia aquimarina TaxID=935700 RepID=A0A0D1EL48_9RHOB|nr:monovalent cation/H(+) antiporter subunit G [Jannaschia aquimarina]KIT16475.1 Na(+)/H(+) antiporter subunit G [Jannaschia aquimarina]SNT07670.1 multisubunit sodium/proton antiporter, MrpG subunit [Jannaschia aquimarina]
MILELFLSACVLLGGFFAFIAGLGVLRLPDVLIRMHASTKAGTLASGLVMLAVAVVFSDPPTIALAVLIVVFLLLTAPVGAHMIGRAAFRSGVKLWDSTVVDPTASTKLGAHRNDD